MNDIKQDPSRGILYLLFPFFVFRGIRGILLYLLDPYKRIQIHVVVGIREGRNIVSSEKLFMQKSLLQESGRALLASYTKIPPPSSSSLFLSSLLAAPFTCFLPPHPSCLALATQAEYGASAVVRAARPCLF